MLFSFGLIRLGFFAAIGAFIGVFIGAIGTIKLLEKVRMMPGLPLSIGLGLILAFAIWGILALAGYRGWGWNAPDLFSSLI
jgi:multisubunit Na+/H+ antiporter MnhB subunit